MNETQHTAQILLTSDQSDTTSVHTFNYILPDIHTLPIEEALQHVNPFILLGIKMLMDPLAQLMGFRAKNLPDFIDEAMRTLATEIQKRYTVVVHQDANQVWSVSLKPLLIAEADETEG